MHNVSMRFWLSHASEIPIREQLVTQVALAILSEDLKPGTRLPSTRELARRFRIHANTVSAAYRDLERDGWLELRHGSGVYVRVNTQSTPLLSALTLDHLIAGLFRTARELGLSLSTVHSRLRRSLELQPPDHFLLIEPSPQLGEIVTEEIKRVVTLPVRVSGMSACRTPEELHGAVALALPTKADMVQKQLPPGTELLRLRLRSVTDSLAQWTPLRGDSLIAIASAWPDFLTQARTMLVAAGLHPDGLLLRDAGKTGWTKGLEQAAGVVCDSLTASNVPSTCRAVPFRLLADSSLVELRRFERFLSQPLT